MRDWSAVDAIILFFVMIADSNYTAYAIILVWLFIGDYIVDETKYYIDRKYYDMKKSNVDQVKDS